MAEEKNKPIEKFRSGVFEVAIWENKVEGKEYKIRNISLTKSVKLDKEWESRTIHIRHNEIRRAIIVLEKAEEFLLMNK